MKSRILPVLSLVLMAGMVTMIGGCGGSSATSADKLTGTASISATAGTPVSPCPGAGQVGGASLYSTPLQFWVTDASGNPLQGITLILYTGTAGGGAGPFWWSEANLAYPYNIPLQTGGTITATTDKNGLVEVYWSTSVLPVSSAPTGTGGNTAGVNQGGTDFVEAYSGILSYTYTVSWVVDGCPANP
jgi:hypothetical protein